MYTNKAAAYALTCRRKSGNVAKGMCFSELNPVAPSSQLITPSIVGRLLMVINGWDFCGKDMSQYPSSAAVVPRLRAEGGFKNCARPEDMLC